MDEGGSEGKGDDASDFSQAVGRRTPRLPLRRHLQDLKQPKVCTGQPKKLDAKITRETLIKKQNVCRLIYEHIRIYIF